MNLGFTTITQAQGRAMLQDKQSGVILLDVREPHEYACSRIPGAINLPLSGLKTARAPQLAKQAIASSTKPLLVYCKGGRRSKVASSILAALNYPTVYDIGGISTWPYEIDECEISANCPA